MFACQPVTGYAPSASHASAGIIPSPLDTDGSERALVCLPSVQKAMAQAPARKPWFVVFTNGAGANQATQVKAMNDLVERQSGAPVIR